jgi:peptidoglycan L-alanyl-D-glutamate endopeptidase CwlK
MAFKFSQRSLDNMRGVHPDLVIVMKRALSTSPIDFMVIEGRRTLERQKELVASGASRTLYSRHLTGHALDVVPLYNGEISWAWPLYFQLAIEIKQAAKDLGVRIEWGGDWVSFKDGPHWQLSRDDYPNTSHEPKAKVPAANPFTAFFEAIAAILAALFGGKK